MAKLDVSNGQVEIRFTRAERVLGLCRDFSFPRDAIESIEVVDDGVDAARGIRAPGLGIPKVRYAGTWRHRKGKDLVSVRRSQPALRIELRDQRYAAVVIGLDDAAAIKERIEQS